MAVNRYKKRIGNMPLSVISAYKYIIRVYDKIASTKIKGSF